MIKIALCDDMELEREDIKNKLNRFQKENDMLMRIDEYSSGEELLKFYGNQYDLIIMDVEMEGINGIEVARQIRENDLLVVLFFSTRHKQYAYDSFSVDAAGYVLKTETYSIFAERLKRAVSKMVKRQKGIEISFGREKRFVELRQILYVTYYNHCNIIRLIDGMYEKSKDSFKSILEKDTEGVLIKINRNMAVNVLWIDECVDGVIKLKSIKREFEVARRKRRYIEELYLEYCRNELL
jgi:DNA-binding LytR/AlgR family response regulator